jgi:hypothetical protein
MSMSNCPHCQAPIPAPKPGASRPLNFCQACGKSLPAASGAVKSSPAKTLMWSGGPIPGLPVKPASPSPEAPPAPAPAPAAAAPAAAGGKRRTATSDIGIAPTIVPPAPESMPVNPRALQKTVIGSGISLPIPGVTPAAPPSPAEVDVSMDDSAASASQNGGEQPAAPQPDAPASPVASPEPSGPKEAEAVPDWAGPAPSVGIGTKVLDRPGKGPNKLMIAGIAGGGLLVVAVVAGLMMGGKSSSTKGQAAAPKPIPAVESPQPVAAPVPANPAPAAEPVKAAPAKAAEAKAEAPAPEKAAAPAEKPAAAAKPVAAAMPAAEKKPVQEKPVQEKVTEHPAKAAPAPKAAPVPAAEKPKAPSEPAPMKAEKTAPAGGDKVNLAAEAFQRGNAKLLSGALPEAIAAFTEAIKLNPKDAQSQRGLGLAYAQSGNAPLAVRHLKLYLKAAPGAPDHALIEKRIEQLSGR